MSALDVAVRFYVDALPEGRVRLAHEVEAERQASGISERTARRARIRAGVRARKLDARRGSPWVTWRGEPATKLPVGVVSEVDGVRRVTLRYPSEPVADLVARHQRDVRFLRERAAWFGRVAS